MAKKNASPAPSGKSPEDRGGSEPRLSPNDDRGNVKNPNHASHAADQANQRTQAERT